MNFKIFNIFLLRLFLLVFCVNAQGSENWSVTLSQFFKNCITPSSNSNLKSQIFIDSLRSCLQKRVLFVMNTILSQKVIPILNGIDLIKFKDPDNFTMDVKHENNQTYNFERNINSKTWRGIIFQRLTEFFKTHVLKFDVEQLMNQYNSSKRSGEKLGNNFEKNEVIEGRRRHHRRRHNLMPMMMMGLLMMGTILIPMGFQFLAILGSKALILAKIALFLSSIQGLKKATNGVNHGIYHSAPVDDGWHDRNHQEPIVQYGLPYLSHQ